MSNIGIPLTETSRLEDQLDEVAAEIRALQKEASTLDQIRATLAVNAGRGFICPEVMEPDTVPMKVFKALEMLHKAQTDNTELQSTIDNLQEELNELPLLADGSHWNCKEMPWTPGSAAKVIDAVCWSLDDTPELMGVMLGCGGIRSYIELSQCWPTKVEAEAVQVQSGEKP